MADIENKHNILKYKYELGTLMAILRLMLAVVAGAGTAYLFQQHGEEWLNGNVEGISKPLMYAAAGASFAIYLFITTFGALITNGKPNRDVILTADHISSPKSVTSLKIITISLPSITNIESVQVNQIKIMRSLIKQTNHRKLVIMVGGEKLTIKSEGLKDGETYDHLFEKLKARCPDLE